MHYVSNISLLLPHSISKPQPFSAMDLVYNPESFPESEEQGRDVEGVEDEDMYEGFEKEDTYEEFQKNQEPDLVDKEVNLNIDTLCLIPDAATVSPPSNGVYLSGLNASTYKAASSGADH
jgi:hypothetical protein